MVAEGVYPKVDGDVLYASEANNFRGFGDGTDGAFSENAGTTNLTQGTVYQYTSFLLDTSATLSASSTDSKPIIIYVNGNCTINGTISLTGKGATTDYNDDLTSTTGTTWGSNGNDAGVTTGGAGGKKGIIIVNFRNNQIGFIMNGTKGGNGWIEAGGGGGASSDNDGSNGTAAAGGASGSQGTGGAGGCSILMIIGGTLTFGASSTVDVSGADGTSGTGRNGGGGGGGAGDILIFHNGAKTDNGVTTDVTGGAGGVGAQGNGGAGGAGNEKIADYNTIFGI